MTQKTPFSLSDAEFAQLLQIGDPLADAAAAELAQLSPGVRESLLTSVLDHGITPGQEIPEGVRRWIEQMEEVPDWVDWDRLLNGSRAFLRAGAVGLFALSCCVTPQFYCLANGNKALSYSGNLHKRAARRGRETSRFVIETCLANNLRRDGDGFKITMRVRLMHAQVRRALSAAGRWNQQELGVPINQVYMASMSALLCARWIDSLAHLGLRFSPEEVDGMMQLWRYSSYLMGVQDPLVFETKAAADIFLAQVERLEPPPDDDARELVQAILDAVPAVLGLSGIQHQRMYDLCEGLAYSLLGEKLAEQLQLKRTLWRHAPLISRVCVPIWDLIARYSPRARKLGQYHSMNLWLGLAEFPQQGGLTMFTVSHPSRD